jgi:hypothetical protein
MLVIGNYWNNPPTGATGEGPNEETAFEGGNMKKGKTYFISWVDGGLYKLSTSQCVRST